MRTSTTRTPYLLLVSLLAAAPGTLAAQARQPDGGPYPYRVRPEEAVCLPASAKVEYRPGDLLVRSGSDPRLQDSLPEQPIEIVDSVAPPVLEYFPKRDMYPVALREERPKGHAQLEFVVRADGKVDPCSMKALDGSHTEFVYAAVYTLLEVRYKPGHVGGRPVAVWVRQRFTYR